MTEREAVDYIDKARRLRGISVKKLCDAMGICIYSYYHLTEGRTAPRLYNILDALHVMGLDMQIVPQGLPAREADGSRP